MEYIIYFFLIYCIIFMIDSENSFIRINFKDNKMKLNEDDVLIEKIKQTKHKILKESEKINEELLEKREKRQKEGNKEKINDCRQCVNCYHDAYIYCYVCNISNRIIASDKTEKIEIPKFCPLKLNEQQNKKL